MSDARIPLALLPGLMSDAWVWSEVQDGLSDIADVRIIDFSQDDAIETMAQRVLDQMPARFALAGWSMGGYVAMAIMARAPERVTRLALIDTQPRRDTPEQAARRAEAVQAVADGGFDTVMAAMRERSYHPEHTVSAEQMAGHVAMSARLGPAVFMRQQKAIRERADQRATLQGVSCPTLVICGQADITTPLAASEEIAAQVPGAELAVLTGAAHMVPVEAPGRTTDLLRHWLLGQAAAAEAVRG